MKIFPELSQILQLRFDKKKFKPRTLPIKKRKKNIPLKMIEFICQQLKRLNKKIPDRFTKMDFSNLQSAQYEMFLFLSKFKISIGEIKEIIFLALRKLGFFDTRKKIRLTSDNLEKLNVAFKKILVYHKINDDLIKNYLTKWRLLLEKSRRETDFYGFITRNYLFSIFQNLFFLSGNRFSKSELKNLFKEFLSQYEKPKIQKNTS